MNFRAAIEFAMSKGDEDRAVIMLQIVHELTRNLGVWCRSLPHEPSPLREDIAKALYLIGAAGRRLNCVFEKHGEPRHEEEWAELKKQLETR